MSELERLQQAEQEAKDRVLSLEIELDTAYHILAEASYNREKYTIFTDYLKESRNG